MDISPILVIDDEPDDVHFVARALKKADLSNPVVVATGADQAQELCSRGATPVLIILDLYLNGRTGLHFLEWLRQQDEPLRDVPVIVFTVSTDKTHQVRAKELRASMFLGKPVTEDALTDVVQAFGLVRTVSYNGQHAVRWLAPRNELRTQQE